MSKNGNVVRRDNTRFAFLAPERRERLPEGFYATLAPRPLHKQVQRILSRK